MQDKSRLPPEQRPALLEFKPVPRRTRRADGWTPARQRAFIEALAELGSVTAAARRVNMSHSTAYDLYNHPEAEELRRAWDHAVAIGAAQVHDAAIERAIHGVPRPVFYKGEQVGEWRHFNERVVTWIMQHHGGDFGSSPSPLARRSRAAVERHAAENCPTCRERREAEAAAGTVTEEQALAAAAELLERYGRKVVSERHYRLSGQVVAADFALRQITFLEIMLEHHGLAELVQASWPGGFSELLNAPPTDFTRELDAVKQQIWAEEAAPPRPPQDLRPDAVRTTSNWGGPTMTQRDLARRAAEARMADAQAEWEACVSEESWAAWLARE
jgi:hypothetical protein